MIAQVKIIKEQIKEIKAQIKIKKEKDLWTPNQPHPTTPIGQDVNDNIIIKQQNYPTQTAKPYTDRNLIDFERGIKLHGTAAPTRMDGNC